MRNILSNSIRKHRDLIWFSIIALLFAGSPSVVSYYFSAGYWYDLRSVKIESGPDFEKLVVVVDRSIYKNFTGDFDVTIWPIDLSGPICHGYGRSIPYKATTAEAISRDAEWLMGNQYPPKCVDRLKVGEKYIANVTVTIHPSQAFLWWMPLPTDEVWTNFFMIQPSKEG